MGRARRATTNERVARIEGTVAGALGRPFPERMAQAPGAETGGGVEARREPRAR